MGRCSDYFQVTNGVHQGGVLSPVFLTIFPNCPLDRVHASGRGWCWDNHFTGALSYADDLTILVPSSDALKKMTADCEGLIDLTGYVSMLPRLK